MNNNEDIGRRGCAPEVWSGNVSTRPPAREASEETKDALDRQLTASLDEFSFRGLLIGMTRALGEQLSGKKKVA